MARTKQNRGRSGPIAMNPVPRLRARTQSNADATVLEAPTPDSVEVPDATVIEVHADGNFNDDTLETEPDDVDLTDESTSVEPDGAAVVASGCSTATTTTAEVVTISSDESKMDTSTATDDSAVSTADGSVCDSSPIDDDVASQPGAYESVSMISDLTRRATAAATNDASLVDVQVVSDFTIYHSIYDSNFGCHCEITSGLGP